ncbi:MAG: hypothetical protein H7839_00985 [Magnetococcus sp. YQC-5]
MQKVITGFVIGFLGSLMLSVYAEQIALPTDYQAGQPIQSSEMNKRFSTIYKALNSLDSAVTSHKHVGADITSGIVPNAHKLDDLESTAFSQEGAAHKLKVYGKLNSTDLKDYGPEVYRMTTGPFTCNSTTRGTLYIAPVNDTGQDGLCICMYNTYWTGGYVHVCFNP